jgi:hypothetical protein
MLSRVGGGQSVILVLFICNMFYIYLFISAQYSLLQDEVQHIQVKEKIKSIQQVYFLIKIYWCNCLMFNILTGIVLLGPESI